MPRRTRARKYKRFIKRRKMHRKRTPYTKLRKSTKFCDATLSYLNYSSTAVISQWSQIAQGTDYNQRIGLDCWVVSAYIRANYSVGTLAATANQNLRVIFFWDSNDDGTAPVAADILEAPGDINSAMNHTNCNRFRVLCDKRMTPCVGGQSGGHWVCYKKMRHLLRFGGTSATLNLRKGQLYSIIYSDTNVGINEPGIAIDCRLRYVDAE